MVCTYPVPPGSRCSPRLVGCDLVLVPYIVRRRREGRSPGIRAVPLPVDPRTPVAVGHAIEAVGLCPERITAALPKRVSGRTRSAGCPRSHTTVDKPPALSALLCYHGRPEGRRAFRKAAVWEHGMHSAR
jgi:hypothetical protein